MLVAQTKCRISRAKKHEARGVDLARALEQRHQYVMELTRNLYGLSSGCWYYILPSIRKIGGYRVQQHPDDNPYKELNDLLKHSRRNRRTFYSGWYRTSIPSNKNSFFVRGNRKIFFCL